ncbi:MAG: sodium:solute symporter [Pirellulaceae bacterium]|nr:sodium:solute symporter [Pirellulaceae bacterium]
MTLAVDPVDLAVLIAYLLAVVVFGLWIGRGVRNMSTYLLGNRDLPWWAILGSIVATETSTATFLSVPGLSYAADGDLRFLQLAFGYIVGRLLVVWFLLPLYFQGRIFTAYEVLEKRFGGATKQVASIVFLVARNLGDGLRLFLTAIVLEKVVGVPLPACVIAIGLATMVYTYFGGMTAVVWNDCLQFVVYMLGGTIAAAVIIYRLPGGVEQVMEYGHATERFRLFDFQGGLSDPFTFWAGLIGGMFLTLGTHGTDQMMVQRYLCASNERQAGWALASSGFVVCGQFALFLLLGVGLACFYHQFPPANLFETNDHVFATFIVSELPAGIGLIGVVLAAVFAAAMSTLSSSLNSSASSAVNDLCAPRLGRASDDPVLLRLSQFFTVAFGGIQIVVAIAASHVTQSVVSDALAIAGFSAGLLLGVFSLALFVPRADQRSALIGLVCGLVCLISVKFALPWLGQFYSAKFSWVPFNLAWPWYPVIGSLATYAGGWCASRITGSSNHEVPN